MQSLPPISQNCSRDAYVSHDIGITHALADMSHPKDVIEGVVSISILQASLVFLCEKWCGEKHHSFFLTASNS